MPRFLLELQDVPYNKTLDVIVEHGRRLDWWWWQLCEDCRPIYATFTELRDTASILMSGTDRTSVF
jgi:hypothetical protein